MEEDSPVGIETYQSDKQDEVQEEQVDYDARGAFVKEESVQPLKESQVLHSYLESQISSQDSKEALRQHNQQK